MFMVYLLLFCLNYVFYGACLIPTMIFKNGLVKASSGPLKPEEEQVEGTHGMRHWDSHHNSYGDG